MSPVDSIRTESLLEVTPKNMSPSSSKKLQEDFNLVDLYCEIENNDHKDTDPMMLQVMKNFKHKYVEKVRRSVQKSRNLLLAKLPTARTETTNNTSKKKFLKSKHIRKFVRPKPKLDHPPAEIFVSSKNGDDSWDDIKSKRRFCFIISQNNYQRNLKIIQIIFLTHHLHFKLLLNLHISH